MQSNFRPLDIINDCVKYGSVSSEVQIYNMKVCFFLWLILRVLGKHIYNTKLHSLKNVYKFKFIASHPLIISWKDNCIN